MHATSSIFLDYRFPIRCFMYHPPLTPSNNKEPDIITKHKIIEKMPHESRLRIAYKKSIDHIYEGLTTDKRFKCIHMDMKNYCRSGEVLPTFASIGSAALAQTNIFHWQFNLAAKSEGLLCSELGFGERRRFLSR